MSRGALAVGTLSSRERLKQDYRQAVLLAQAYPQLAEVHVQFDFKDGTQWPPSPQSFSYFVAARSLFRYPCPSHACNGQFDLLGHVTELAERPGRGPRSRQVTVTCQGQRLHAPQGFTCCPVQADIRISATLRAPGQP